MSAECYTCLRPIAAGESAWADDWTVVEAGGVRHEIRLTCDDCDEAIR